MRKSFGCFMFILLVAVPCGKTQAQAIAFSRLLQLYNTSIDSFDTYATKQGYTFLKSAITNGNDTVVVYAFHPNDSTLKAERFITKTIHQAQDKKTISYQTVYISEYLELKNQIKAAGFHESGSAVTPTNTGVSIAYTNGQNMVYLNSALGNTDPKKKVIVYEVKIVAADLGY